MRVRDALLVLLSRKPAHGYQLKVDYERLTGAGPINVGQVYTTLDRLGRDGLVNRQADTSDRRVPYYLTAEGRKVAQAWLLDPDDVSGNGRSAVAGKVLLALSMPGIDVFEVIDSYRLALLASVQRTRQRARHNTTHLEEKLIIEAQVAVADAELRWLDLCETELRNAKREP